MAIRIHAPGPPAIVPALLITSSTQPSKRNLISAMWTPAPSGPF
ncbi:hypothetical protein [Micromonospora sp. NPDC051296]